MASIDQLFDYNADWAARIKAEDPGFFDKLSKQQSPEYPVDWLLGQPGPGQPDYGSVAWRDLCPSECGQYGGSY